MLDSYLSNNFENIDLPSSIINKLNKKPLAKSNIDSLKYSCIKLEILANIESLKKDSELRQSIQMEMLTNKFNKTSNDLNSIDELVLNFINNLSAKPTAPEKTLWKRISKTLPELI